MKELYWKIVALDDDDIQAVVDIITETGCYEMNSVSFDFDLTQLQKATIGKLDTLITASIASRRECTTSPSPSKTMWLQLSTTAKEFSIKDLEKTAVESDESLKIEAENIPIKSKPRKIRKVACNARKFGVMENRIVAVHRKKTKRTNRETTRIATDQLKNENVKTQKSETEEIAYEDAKVNDTKKLVTSTQVIKIKKLQQRNRKNEVIPIDKVQVERIKRIKRYRCQLCGKKQSSANKSKKYICRRCVKMQKKNILVDNTKKIKMGRCRRCIMKRKKTTNGPTYSTALTPLNMFYNLCATLALSPKKASWNGRALL